MGAFIPQFGPMRSVLDPLSAAAAATFGTPGFFTPRLPSPFFASDTGGGAPSVYDTKPLKATLEELVDFDLINRREVRLSLGAVDLRKGNSVYFDDQEVRIGPDHVRASGSLPPVRLS
jgi:NTE family protein